MKIAKYSSLVLAVLGDGLSFNRGLNNGRSHLLRSQETPTPMAFPCVRSGDCTIEEYMAIALLNQIHGNQRGERTNNRNFNRTRLYRQKMMGRY